MYRISKKQLETRLQSSWQGRGTASPAAKPPRAGWKPRGSLLEPGSWKHTALCSGFSSSDSNKTPAARMTGSAHTLYPGQTAGFAAAGAGEPSGHQLFPQVLAEMCRASSPCEDRSAGTSPPLPALLAKSFLHPSDQFPGSLSPSCDEQRARPAGAFPSSPCPPEPQLAVTATLGTQVLPVILHLRVDFSGGRSEARHCQET